MHLILIMHVVVIILGVAANSKSGYVKNTNSSGDASSESISSSDGSVAVGDDFLPWGSLGKVFLVCVSLETIIIIPFG